MSIYLVRGREGYRAVETTDEVALRAELTASREAIAHKFGPKMTLPKVHEKAARLNESLANSKPE